MVSRSRHTVAQQLATIIRWGLWFVFGCLLAFSAIIDGRVTSSQWQTMAEAFGVLALLSVPFAFKPKLPLFDRSAAVFLLILMLMAVWALLPALFSTEHGFHELVFPIDERPAWFDPDLYWSITPTATVAVFMRDFMIVCACFIVLTLCRSRRQLYALLGLMLGTAVVHSALGLIAWVNNVHLVEIQQLDGHFSALRGLFVNRNHFASFVTLATLGGWVAVLYSNRQASELSWLTRFSALFLSGRWLVVAVLAFVYFCVLMTQSRAGVLGLVIILMVVVINLVSRNTHASGRWFKLAGAGFSVVVVSMMVVGFYGVEVAERFVSSGQLLGERIPQWRVTFDAILQRPWLGYGAGSYATVFEYFRLGTPLRDVIFDQAHNDWLHLWLEQGLIGLLLWTFLMVWALRHAVQQLTSTRSRLHSALLVAVLAVCGAALLQSWVDFNLQIVSIRLFFFVSLSLVFIDTSRLRS